jgi:hypothetical protein
MSRDQQNQIFSTATANSKQDQATGVAATNQEENDLSSYYGNDPYQAGGQFSKDQSTINASRANADSAAVGDALTRHGQTSGENTSGYGSNLVSATQKATLDEGTAQANSDAERIGDETKYQQFGIGAENQIAGQNLNAANSALSTGQQAAKEPGVLDTLFNDAIQGSKTGAAIAG